jgi:hypothetical protein
MNISKSQPEGNAFNIMIQVRRYLFLAHKSDEWPDVEKEMQDGDYDTLCEVAERVTYGSIKIVD